MYNKLWGRFSFDTLQVRQTGKVYVPPQELAVKIDAIWCEAQVTYKDKIWNGVNYRLDKIENENGVPIIFISEEDYKNNYASKLLADEIKKLQFNERLNCLYISTLLETRDSYFVLGNTAALGIHGRTTALLGGILNKDEMILTSGAALESYIYKELEEELGINLECIVRSEGLGIYEMPTMRIGIFAHTQLTLTSEEFRNAVRINDEHEGYIIISKDEILQERTNSETLYNRGVFLALDLLLN
jgi:hypothetical protein